MTSIKHFLKLLRVSHWTKASFVLLGVFYSGSLSHWPQALGAALSFCFIASAVYIYNDLQDLAEDRLHPQKCYRPLAVGIVSTNIAIVTILSLLVSGFVIASFLSSTLVILLCSYLVINLIYNHSLKNIPLLDVICIASGFLLRVLAGTIGIGLSVSWWLAIATLCISLFIGFCKRKIEKHLSFVVTTRFVLQKYSTNLLDWMIMLTALSSFATYLGYVLYVQHESFYFVLTLPFAACGLWRFIWLTNYNSHIPSDKSCSIDDPVTLFFKDRLSCLNLLCFLLLTLLALQHNS